MCLTRVLDKRAEARLKRGKAWTHGILPMRSALRSEENFFFSTSGLSLAASPASTYSMIFSSFFVRSWEGQRAGSSL